MAVSFDANGTPVYPEWSTEAQTALFEQFGMLDPDGQGLDRSKLRVFYPYMGWNDLQKGLDALIASGRLVSSIAHVGGRPVEIFTRKEG